MTHARTLTRYACLAGLVAGLLAPVSSLAQGFPSGHPYHSSNSRANIAAKYGIAMSQQSGTAMVEVGYRARHTGLPGGVTRYTNGRALIPAATIRTGALSALARGVMHPGLQVAILAAGWAYSQSDGIHILDTSHEEFSPLLTHDYTADGHVLRISIPSPAQVQVGNYFASPMAALSATKKYYLDEYTEFAGWHSINYDPPTTSTSGRIEYRFWYINNNGDKVYSSKNSLTVYPLVPYDAAPSPYEFEPIVTPVPEAELTQLDPHLPPELVDELWEDSGSIPEWEEAITMLPFDNVFAEGNTTSEVYQSARQANENLYAQLSGEPEPNPDQTTIGGTAADEMVDMWNQPIPNFPEAEPEWQVEEITTLPDFSFGLGAGSCPAPVTIPHPLGGSFTIEFQKFCDLASMIRGAVIAICMILALYIVLGTRATTS